MVLTGLLVARAFNNTRASSERRLLESARVDAAALDREFDGAINVLQALATSPALDVENLSGFQDDARRVQATQVGWRAVTLLSLDGRELVSTRSESGSQAPPATEPDSLRRLLATRRPAVGPLQVPSNGGTELLFAIRVPVSRDGQLKFVVSALVDVASLERIVPKLPDSSDEWNRTLLDSNGTIAVRTRGAAGYVGTQVNPAFRERLRSTPESVTAEITREGVSVYAATARTAHGWAAVAVVPRAGLDGPLNASVVAILTGGGVLVLCGLAAALWVARRLSSDLRAATTAAEAVAQGKPVQVVGAHVVETRQLQESLVSAASLLEHRAHERDEQLRRAEQANQVKDQFLAVLGHELRNPLAPALTALEVMRVRNPEASKREREVLERQVAHMTRLVNDLLDVSRLARGKVELVRKAFELHEAVERAVDVVQPLMDQKRHTLQVDLGTQPLVIDGDIDRIVQILTNLLTNAAKYTPAGGRVALTATQANDRARLECLDNGPGIALDLAPSLFDTFAQGPRTLDRHEGGLGLGLALARNFAELHGGTLSYETATAGGSRFVLELPLAEHPSGASVTATTSRRTPVNPLRILVVDDNVDAADMLRVALENAGHFVATASSGLEALADAPSFRPDVGVLDIGLPGMDGYELARRMRQLVPAIRLIALTGYGQRADKDAAERAGFAAHFAKPLPIESLLDALVGLPSREL